MYHGFSTTPINHALASRATTRTLLLRQLEALELLSQHRTWLEAILLLWKRIPRVLEPTMSVSSKRLTLRITPQLKATHPRVCIQVIALRGKLGILTARLPGLFALLIAAARQPCLVVDLSQKMAIGAARQRELSNVIMGLPKMVRFRISGNRTSEQTRCLRPDGSATRPSLDQLLSGRFKETLA